MAFQHLLTHQSDIMKSSNPVIMQHNYRVFFLYLGADTFESW